MKESIHFTFDGIASDEMGVVIVSSGGGLHEETFLPYRTIIETKISNNHKPYFQRVDYEPLSFSLTFFIHEWRDRDNLRQIAKWLMQDYYKPLTFQSNPDRIFYAMFEGESSLIHNGCKDGYLTLQVRCNSPFTYSRKQVFDNMQIRSGTPSENNITIYNSGDMDVKPKVWITKRNGNGSISIENEDTNQTMEIAEMLDNERIFIDLENEDIVSDLEYLNIYRLKDFNDVWLKLEVGTNNLKCVGDFDLEIEYQMVYLAD